MVSANTLILLSSLTVIGASSTATIMVHNGTIGFGESKRVIDDNGFPYSLSDASESCADQFKLVYSRDVKKLELDPTASMLSQRNGQYNIYYNFSIDNQSTAQSEKYKGTYICYVSAMSNEVSNSFTAKIY